MSFRHNLSRARSHIVFILGLLAATAVIWSIEGAALDEHPDGAARRGCAGVADSTMAGKETR